MARVTYSGRYGYFPDIVITPRRTSPIEDRKETVMIKLTMQHVNAICHLEFLAGTSQASQQTARFNKQIEDDLLRTAELKLYIIEKMIDPQKTFEEHDGV